jgi:hypothetical protein
VTAAFESAISLPIHGADPAALLSTSMRSFSAASGVQVIGLLPTVDVRALKNPTAQRSAAVGVPDGVGTAVRDVTPLVARVPPSSGVTAS